MIELKFTGTADEIRQELCQLFQSKLEHRSIGMSPVSDVSSDTSHMTATEAAAVETVATSKPARRGRPAKNPPPEIEATATSVTTEPQQAINTGDERVDPETTADEAVDLTPYAEPTKPVEEAKTYTMEDVRNAATPYIKKHTMAFAQLDLQDCLEAAVGIRQISKLNPADQAQLKKAIDAFDAAGKAEARFVKAA